MRHMSDAPVMCVRCKSATCTCEVMGVGENEEHQALFESNKRRLAALAGRGFGFNMQPELMDEVIGAVFGAPGSPTRVAWQLRWERRVATRLDEAEVTAAQVEAQRLQAMLQQGVNGELHRPS